ncbi:MAG: Sir2 family NAD-dependent protein deacetylase [Proteobacteria bacterium]|nr:Sir2 family NAD-dependent protein deacetylase [Pseudomonadota bacterium]
MNIEKAAATIRKARKVIALTGAGVSTESGIPDFRSKGGLWSRYDPEEYGTIGAFRRDPVKVWKMLAELCEITEAEPNSGHLALAALEAAGFLQGIITQNIDGLHQKAGSSAVVEFHGSLATFSCLDCGKSVTLQEVRQRPLPPPCPVCARLLKPDIVFFDELIPDDALVDAGELVAGADCLIVAGTSCQVMPAARIPGDVSRQGGTIIEINREPTLGPLADLVLTGAFVEIMGRLATELAGERGKQW